MSTPPIPHLILPQNKLQNYEEEYLDYRYSYQLEFKSLYNMNFFHWHRFYEILFIKEGNYKLTNNQKTVRSDRPGIFIHKPFSLHNMNSYGEIYHRRLLYASREVINRFTLQVVDQDLFSNANLIYGWPDANEVEELDSYFTLAGRYKEDPLTTAQLCSLTVRRIMQMASEGRGEIVSCPYSYIQDVLNYAADNLSDRCTIEQVADQFHVGKSKFQADFKTVTGISYHQYLIGLRLKLAYDMIEEGNSIMKTALECGYSSESHFIKAFREYWNCTPGQLRERTVNTDTLTEIPF